MKVTANLGLLLGNGGCGQCRWNYSLILEPDDVDPCDMCWDDDDGGPSGFEWSLEALEMALEEAR